MGNFLLLFLMFIIIIIFTTIIKHRAQRPVAAPHVSSCLLSLGIHGLLSLKLTVHDLSGNSIFCYLLYVVFPVATSFLNYVTETF
jgi:uncharacterized membrane protein YoaK (UPF0700 family)